MAAARSSVRPPCAPLAPFVQVLWAFDGRGEDLPGAPRRELVLPTGAMHLAIRLGEPLRVLASADDEEGTIYAGPVVGGARATAYRKAASRAASVGAQLTPTGAALLGARADELAHRHTALEDLWGARARSLHVEVAEASCAEARIAVLERALLARVDRALPTSPVIAHALRRFALERPAQVGRVAAESGYSHRAFMALFRRQVGLSPKLYGRVLRAQRAVRLLSRGERPLVDVALAAGYADQPHMGRELREILGITPAAYRAAAPEAPNHVPLA